jgi:hypothetical protein
VRIRNAQSKTKIMKMRTTVKTHDNLIGQICGKTAHGYVVKFANGKERHFLLNQVRPFDTSKVNTYTPPSPIAEELKQLKEQVQQRYEGLERLKLDAEQYTADYARGVAFAYGVAMDMLEMILNKK